MIRSNGSCRQSSGKPRIALACSAVMLSRARPCWASSPTRSAGTASLPSMVLIVSSRTVAADTWTTGAVSMSLRARGPSRGLSSRTHSAAWLSRSSNVVTGVVAVEHPLNVRVGCAELPVVVGDLAPEPAEPDRCRPMRDQLRDRLTGLGDDDLLAGRHLLQQS